MDQIPEDNEHSLESWSTNAENFNISLVKEEEQSSGLFICYLCHKSFYNAKALQNHKSLQHILGGTCSEDEKNTNFVANDEQSMNDSINFTFIPYTNPDEVVQTTEDGLTTRVFSEDTSYLIVKVEVDEGAKLQLRPAKEPVDIRGPFTCTFFSSLRPEMQCRQTFLNCCEYSMHYRQEHTKRRKAALRCQVCEKTLEDFNSRNSQPQYNITFWCRVCVQTFLNSADFDEHNRIKHAKTKAHQCSVCWKRFTQQGGLQQHMRMHTGIRPFECTFCAKAFTQKAGLDQHLRTHTKVKPFRCVVCSKGFSQSVHLRQHMRTHTNIQPFECCICGKRFKQSSHLNFHMRSHMGYPAEPGVSVIGRYTELQNQEHTEFLNLANVQPVQDGDTLYYAADMAPGYAHT